jgi:hypothetical protein
MRALSPLSLEQLETQPFRISGTAHLDADPLAVFAELGDPSLWFPLMRRSVWKTAATSGVGAEREIVHAVLGRARERMLAWEPGECVAFTMTEATTPFANRIGERWRLEREGIYTRVDWLFVATLTRTGRLAAPVMRQMMRLLFMRGCMKIGKRAGSFRGESRGKHVS